MRLSCVVALNKMPGININAPFPALILEPIAKAEGDPICRRNHSNCGSKPRPKEFLIVTFWGRTVGTTLCLAQSQQGVGHKKCTVYLVIHNCTL